MPPRPLKALLALTATILVAVVAIAVFNAHRALTRASQSAVAEHELPFNLRAFVPAAAQTVFEPVSSAPAYTTGAFFAGRLYLAGPAGLSVLGPDGRLLSNLRTGLELPVSPITAVVQARLRGAEQSQLLLATAGTGLLMLDDRGKAEPSLRQLLPGDAEAADLTAVLPLSTGDVLLGTRRRGVLLWNGVDLTPLGFSVAGVDPTRLQITALAGVDSSSFLIGTRNAGVFYAHAGTFVHADIASGLPDNQVESIAVAEGHAYVGTPVGIADFDLAKAGETSPLSLRPARILAEGVFAHTLVVDGASLSVGSFDQGIQTIPLDGRAHLRRASISAPSSSESSHRIDAFLSAPGVVYALVDGGLTRRDGSGWSSVALPGTAQALTDRNVSALAYATDGTLMVGYFDRGLDEFHPDGIVRHFEDDTLFCVNRFALDPVRRTIAAATANGLVLFDARGNPRQTLTRGDGLISDHVTDIAYTATGTALATPAGITFVDPAGTTSLYAFEGLVNNHVYAIAARPGSNEVLAGTLGGLSVLQGEAVKSNLTVQNSGLKHNWITALLPMPDGGYLVGTYGAGVETMDREGHLAPIALPAGTPRDLVVNPNAIYATPSHVYAGTLGHGMLVYSNATGRWTQVAAGLPSYNVTAFAARAGTLMIGTENGLVRVTEANLP